MHPCCRDIRDEVLFETVLVTIDGHVFGSDVVAVLTKIKIGGQQHIVTVVSDPTHGECG